MHGDFWANPKMFRRSLLARFIAYHLAKFVQRLVKRQNAKFAEGE